MVLVKVRRKAGWGLPGRTIKENIPQTLFQSAISKNDSHEILVRMQSESIYINV